MCSFRVQNRQVLKQIIFHLSTCNAIKIAANVVYFEHQRTSFD